MNDNENVLNVIDIAKQLYAEAMLKKYWNMYNSGVDGQAIVCFLEKQRNQITKKLSSKRSYLTTISIINR